MSTSTAVMGEMTELLALEQPASTPMLAEATKKNPNMKECRTMTPGVLRSIAGLIKQSESSSDVGL